METATLQTPAAKVTATFADIASKNTEATSDTVKVVVNEAAKAAGQPLWKGIAVKAGIAAAVLGIAGGAYLLYRSYWKKPEAEGSVSESDFAQAVAKHDSAELIEALRAEIDELRRKNNGAN